MKEYITYSIVSMIFIGIAALTRKLGITNSNQAIMGLAIESLIVGILGLMLAFILKKTEIPLLKYTTITGVLMLIGLALFFTALSKGPVSITQTIFSLSTVVLVLLAAFVLKEPLTLTKILGITLSIIGVILLGI